MLERRKNIHEGEERMWETVHKQHFSVQAARDGLTIMILMILYCTSTQSQQLCLKYIKFVSLNLDILFFLTFSAEKCVEKTATQWGSDHISTKPKYRQNK